MKDLYDGSFAYIFDMDGVLIDSMENYYRAFRDVLFDRLGVRVERDYYLAMSGSSESFQLNDILARFGLEADRNELLAAIHNYYLGIMQDGKPIECNVLLLRLLLKQSVPVAVASGSASGVIRSCLRLCGIEDVPVIVSVEEVKNGKPDPEAFLLAANKLGFEPKDCVVVEDSDAGAAAAKAAGMRLLRFYDIKI